MKKLPIVALVGQTNAGKSSILNRLARKNIAIVAREEGTTRDNVMARIHDRFLLVDTAGLKNPEDDFEASIQEQINDAIDSAEIILVTVDSTKYFDHHDKNIAKSALRSKKPVFLILNKSDRGEALPVNDFRALGIPEERIIRTSATTGQGMKDLEEEILKVLRVDSKKGESDRLPGEKGGSVRESGERDGDNKGERRDVLKIALIGRPNVGKSSLFNSLGKKQQAIVSSRQGTTRDINRIQVRYNGRDVEILDTAGLRRPGKREVGIEKFSAIRTLAAIEEADVCALLVDSTEPHSKLDQSLAGQIVEAGKGIVVVVTKMDLMPKEIAENPTEDGARKAGAKNAKKTDVENEAKKASAEDDKKHILSPVDNLLNELERDFNFLPFAPVLLTSSETGKNVTKLFDLAEQIEEARHHEIKTTELNRILKDAVASHPPAGLKNTHPKPKYIVQTDTNPPWFVIHGHDLGLMHWSYKRFLERKIREHYSYFGTPIFLSFRSDNSSRKNKD